MGWKQILAGTGGDKMEILQGWFGMDIKSVGMNVGKFYFCPDKGL